MTLVELTEKIIKNIVKDEDAVSVKEFPSENDKEIIIEVLVSDSDIGRVIGKNGRTANAIRTLVQASSALKDNKYVKINIDKFQGLLKVISFVIRGKNYGLQL